MREKETKALCIEYSDVRFLSLNKSGCAPMVGFVGLADDVLFIMSCTYIDRYVSIPTDINLTDEVLGRREMRN